MPRELTIALPDDLAEQAKPLGLLRSEILEELLREEVRRRAWKQLTTAMDRMDAEGSVPPMTSEEIETEIEAARAKRRSRLASRR